MELLGIYGEVNALEEKNTSDFMSRGFCECSRNLCDSGIFPDNL